MKDEVGHINHLNKEKIFLKWSNRSDNQMNVWKWKMLKFFAMPYRKWKFLQIQVYHFCYLFFLILLFRSYISVSERPNPISYFPDGYPLILILFIKYIILLHWFEIPALSETNPSIYLHLLLGYLFSSCTKLFSLL